MKPVRLVIAHCRRHPSRTAVIVEKGSTGYRIAGSKCCGIWDEDLSFKIDPAEVATHVQRIARS